MGLGQTKQEELMQSLSKNRLKLWLKLLRSSRRIEAVTRERLRTEFKTTLPRFDVMATLYRTSDGLKMSELSKQLMVSNGNVTGIIDRLVDEGSVMRVSIVGDRRASLVKLTDQGRTDFAAMAEAHESWINELMDGIEDEDIDTAFGLFQKIQGDPK